VPQETQIQANQQQSRAQAIPGRPTGGTVFLLVLATVALYFSYVIARPFLAPIFLALMIAIVFHPIHRRIQRRIQGRNSAALISTILVLVAVVVPTLILGILVAREAHSLYLLLSERSAEQGGWNPFVMHLVERLSRWAGHYVDLSKFDFRGTLMRSLEQVSRVMFSWSTHILSNIVEFFAAAVVVFLTLFFLFRDGKSIKTHAAAFLPLKPSQSKRLFTEVSNSIVANVHGCLAVGASQGILLSLGFWMLGLPSPILWGLVTGLCSMIPVVGSAAVWLPASVFFFIGGHWVKGLIMLAWGAALVSQIDNVVRPHVISERANMHPLLIFFTLLGGVKAFGPIGLFVGPVVLSLTLVVLQLLREANVNSSPADAVP
jgi:predicted PurR-regulated permease PerM